MVSNSPGAVIRRNRIHHFSDAIWVSGASPQIVDNDLWDCAYGVNVWASDALIAENRVSENQIGLFLYQSVRITVRGNFVHDNRYWGLYGGRVQGGTIRENALVRNGRAAGSPWGGLYLWASSSVHIVDNTIQENQGGVFLDGGEFYRIYHNWFVNNDPQAYDTSSGTLWDLGYPTGGNHWSDYGGDDLYRGVNQNIPGPDGIGDTARLIPPNVARDRYPFYSVPAPDVVRQVTAQAVGDDIILSWQPAAMADAYVVHTASDPTRFDFASPRSVGNVTSWTDAGAAVSPRERYYIVQAGNTSLGRTGPTSNTAGKWTHVFPPRMSTFSLPLDEYPWIDYSNPEWVNTGGELAAATGASRFGYMENSRWRTVPGDGDPDRPLATGEGYVVWHMAAAVFTFTGLPGTVIDHAGWPPYPERGFDPLGTAQGISAQVQGDDVSVAWPQLPDFGPPSGSYLLYASRSRAGLRGFPGLDYTLLATVAATAAPRASYAHSGALMQSPEWYYFVVPIRDVYWRGSSTYSIGVTSTSLPAGYSAIGLPLRPFANGTYSAVQISDLLGTDIRGVEWFDLSRQDWVAHAAWMPAGTYDPPFTMIMAVQVDSEKQARVVFIGV